jgi:hypothetical protein
VEMTRVFVRIGNAATGNRKEPCEPPFPLFPPSPMGVVCCAAGLLLWYGGWWWLRHHHHLMIEKDDDFSGI